MNWLLSKNNAGELCEINIYYFLYSETTLPPSDLPLSKTYPPPTNNTTTPSADLHTMSSNSSISKDSLLNASFPEKSTSEEVQPPPSKIPEGGASTTFTVDFGEESPNKSMSGKSLSEFMPSKIRKSFKDRKEKVVSTKGKEVVSTKGKEVTSKDSSPGSEKVRKQAFPFWKIQNDFDKLYSVAYINFRFKTRTNVYIVCKSTEYFVDKFVHCLFFNVA